MQLGKKQYALPRNYSPVGQFLREGRLKAGLTQRTVSLKLGYSSAQFISNFECGVSTPPLKKMKELVSMYRLDIERLIELTTECQKNILRTELKGRGKKVSFATNLRN